MHEKPMPGEGSGDQQKTNIQEDLQWQERVLALILDEDPHQLSEAEIVRELAGERPAYAQADAARRAIEELVRAGLLRRCETLVLLTKPARHMASLEIS